MSLLDRIWKKDDLGDEFSLDGVDDGTVGERLVKSLKKPYLYVGLLGVFLVYAPAMIWFYGFTPTELPAQVKMEGRVPGQVTVGGFADSINKELDRGWVANDLFKFLYPHRRWFQFGEWQVWKVTSLWLNVHISQEGRSVQMDEHLDNASSAIGYFPDVWYSLPNRSTESNLRLGVAELEEYVAALPTKQNFYPRGNNLKPLLEYYSFQLNQSAAALRAKDIFPFQGYIPFEAARGRVYAMLQSFRLIERDFGDEVFGKKAGATSQLREIIRTLEEAFKLNYWVILNGGWGMKDDLSELSNLVNEAEKAISSLANTLEKS